MFLFLRWTQTNTRASATVFQWQWGKMVPEAWQRAGLPLSSATPCRDCASLASMRCSRSSTVTCWERWGHTHTSALTSRNMRLSASFKLSPHRAFFVVDSILELQLRRRDQSRHTTYLARCCYQCKYQCLENRCGKSRFRLRHALEVSVCCFLTLVGIFCCWVMQGKLT